MCNSTSNSGSHPIRPPNSISQTSTTTRKCSYSLTYSKAMPAKKAPEPQERIVQPTGHCTEMMYLIPSRWLHIAQLQPTQGMYLHVDPSDQLYLSDRKHMPWRVLWYHQSFLSPWDICREAEKIKASVQEVILNIRERAQLGQPKIQQGFTITWTLLLNSVCSLHRAFLAPAFVSAMVWCGEKPTSEVDEALLIWANTLASPNAVARIHRTGKSNGRIGKTPFTWKKQPVITNKHRDNSTETTSSQNLSHDIFSKVRG